MKKLVVIFLLFNSNLSLANLYIKTVYQEAQKPTVDTKHHIFLEKRYTIDYSLKRYVLILKKITENEATIESESYNIDKRGNKTLHGGAYGSYKLGKHFALTHRGPDGKKLFTLKIYLEKIVPTIP